MCVYTLYTTVYLLYTVYWQATTVCFWKLEKIPCWPLDWWREVQENWNDWTINKDFTAIIGKEAIYRGFLTVTMYS